MVIRMSLQASPIELSSALYQEGQSHYLPVSAAQRLLASVWSERGKRVLAMLAALAVLNGLDLLLTLSQAGQGADFVELNPLASSLLGSAAGLVLFKLALVGASSAVLFRYRRQRITEIACLLLCGAYGLLAVRWGVYYMILA